MFGNIFQKKDDKSQPVEANAPVEQTQSNGDPLTQNQPQAMQSAGDPPAQNDTTLPASQSQNLDSPEAAEQASAIPAEQKAEQAPQGTTDDSRDALGHLDPRASQLLTHAQEETKRIHQEQIEPEQLLVGALHDDQLFKNLEEIAANVGTLLKEMQAVETMGTYKGQPILSKNSQDVFAQAYRDAKMRGSNLASPEDVFLVLFSSNYSTAKMLESHGLKKEAVIDKFAKNPNLNYSKKTVLEKYAIDLTQEAREGKLDPVAGRDKEVDRIVHIISRRTKNNPIIIGETGVGKTAIVEGLAQQIVAGTVPKDLQDKRIFQLDLASLIAGASHRGEFEERLRSVINEVLASNNKIVLFIDEIHTLMGSGDGEGMNAANLIKPYLARGQLQIIGATTTTEYRKNFEKDKAFERRFQPVTAEEPSDESAFEMLKVIRPKYEKFHGVTLPDDALKECIKLSKKYIGERYLPDKAIDLLDEACSEVKLQRDKGKRQDLAVKKADIEIVVSAWTGIPVTKLTEDESEKLLKLEEKIHERLIGQNEAVIGVSEAVRRGRIGLAAGSRPIASFVFLGPTGVGKTELAKTLAELLFGRDDAMARLDMSEYMEKHEVAKLIGAPPGYVGYEEGGQLTEAVRKKPYSIVLFDEIEKAHPDVFNLLLQLLEDGRLTDNKGNTISFKNTIVICTSNIGSALIQKMLGSQDKTVKRTPEEYEKSFKQLQVMVREELIKFFRPELLNRFDEVIVFEPLRQEHMAGIARLGIAKTAGLLKEQGFNLQISEKAVARLATDGYDPVYGARPLRRLVQTAIENPIALAIISKQFVVGDTIVIDFSDNTNEFVFHKGSLGKVEPLNDEAFKSVLKKIAHPEAINSIIDRQRFTDFHTKVEDAVSKGDKLASSILAISDVTAPQEVARIRKELEAGRGNKNALAEEILALADTQAQQVEINNRFKKIIMEFSSPEALTAGKKKELFTQLHDELAKEKQNNNSLAVGVLGVKEQTKPEAIEQLMEDIKRGKEEGSELASKIFSTLNNEITEEADKERETDPSIKFKKILHQLVNPLYFATAENKNKFSKIHDNINQASMQGNPLAASILAFTDITSDEDIKNLRESLMKARDEGDILAKEIMDTIDADVKNSGAPVVPVEPVTTEEAPQPSSAGAPVEQPVAESVTATPVAEKPVDLSTPPSIFNQTNIPIAAAPPPPSNSTGQAGIIMPPLPLTTDNNTPAATVDSVVSATDSSGASAAVGTAFQPVSHAYNYSSSEFIEREIE